MVKWITIVIAVAGLAVGVYTALTATEKLPNLPPAQPPSVNPFPHGLAATGIVEASTRNVGVSAPEPGAVFAVKKQVGDLVKIGEPLFEMDRRTLEAELLQAQSAVAKAQSQVAQLQAMPRAEDVPPLEAAAEQSRANYLDWKDQFERLSTVAKSDAAYVGEITRKQYLVRTAEAQMHAAEANLAKMKAGAWAREIDVAKAELQAAEAAVKALQLRIDRLTVRSPVDGTVLKRNIEPGEYSTPGNGDPAMIVGDLTRLHIRAQVDEADAPRVCVGAPGAARPRGAIDVSLPLEMIRIEPMAMPKRQLTGLVTEQVDTRIVEVLFRIVDTKGVSIYPGQLIDVYIQSPDPATTAPAPKTDNPPAPRPTP
jgi:HlyD family secretion protein